MKLFIKGKLILTKNVVIKAIYLFKIYIKILLIFKTCILKKILKKMTTLKIKKVYLRFLKSIDVNLCTISNNNILKYNQKGVIDSLKFKKNKTATVVKANKKEKAPKIFYIDSTVGKIAVINIAENEWASATDTLAGANGMNLIDDVNQTKNAKATNEKVICGVHCVYSFFIYKNFTMITLNLFFLTFIFTKNLPFKEIT
mgnify:CR=1 FL=1